MEYRVYLMGNKGYELATKVKNKEDLWYLLDELIITEEYDKTIMVIERTEITDKWFYTYNGNIDDYISFRYNTNAKTKVKRS